MTPTRCESQSLVDIILQYAKAVPSDIVQAIELYSHGKVPAEVMRGIPLRTARRWAKAREVVVQKGLEKAVFQAATGIFAREQLTKRGIGSVLGYPQMISLATFLSGETKTAGETRGFLADFMTSAGFPLLTKEHQVYVDNFNASFVAAKSKDVLQAEIPLSQPFSLNPDVNTYSPFLHELSMRISRDHALQYALFQKWTGIGAQEQIVAKGANGSFGYNHFKALASLLQGQKSETDKEVGKYFKFLARDAGMPVLTLEHEEYIYQFDDSYIARTPATQLKQELLISKKAVSLDPESKMHSPFVAALAGKISADPQLQIALFRKLTGIEAQEQLVYKGDEDDVPRFSQLHSLATLLSGSRKETVSDVGQFLRDWAKSASLPELTLEHQAMVHNFDVAYVKRTSPAALMETVKSLSNFSLDPAALRYSPLLRLLAEKISADMELRLALTKRVHPLFERRDDLEKSPKMNTFNALLSGTANPGARANAHIANLHYFVDGNIVDSLSEAQESIQAYGESYLRAVSRENGLGKDLDIAAQICFPHLLYSYVAHRQNGHSPRLFFNTTSSEAIRKARRADKFHIIKMARDQSGSFLSLTDYFRFTQQVFKDKDTLTEAGSDTMAYVTQGNFRDVSVIEEVVDPTSRNPNFRMRMFLSTNPVLKSTATLDTFVKFYPGAEERNLEASLNIYLHDIAQVSSVGKARVAQLQREVKVRCQESGDYTYTLLTADAVRDRHNAGCGYALITPFVNLRSVEDCIVEDREETIPLLQRINTVLSDLHTRGIENIEKISAVDGANVLREHFKPIDYSKQKYRFMKSSGELDKVVSSLGISDLLNQSAASYPSLIHGDPHPRNIGLKKNDEVILLDFESEFTGVGASQVDLAKLYRHRSLELSMQDKVGLVNDYMQQRKIIPQNYLLGFHAAMVYTTLVHMQRVTEKFGLSYTPSEARAALVRDSQMLLQHTTTMYGKKDAQRLVHAAQQEFRLT